MLQSIIVYSLLLVIMLLCTRVAARKGSYIRNSSGEIKQRSFWRFEIIFPILLFSIIFGMRFDVGKDYLAYLNGYELGLLVGKGEVIFTWLTQLFRVMDFHYVIYFSILTFIQIFFFFYAFKRERFIFPLLVLFLFLNGAYMSWMNIIRQSLAMCIWIYALRYIEEQKLWKYLLWCGVAFCFHLSAIILVFFYPILRKGKDYFKSIALQIALLFAVFVIQQLFGLVLGHLKPIMQFYQSLVGDSQYGYTLESLNSSLGEIKGSGLAYLFKILLNVLIVFYSIRLKKFYNSKWFNIVYFFFFIGLLTLYIFPVGAIILTRPFRYFYIFQTIMYAYFAYYLVKSRLPYNKVIYYSLIIAFLGIFYLSQITASPDSHLWYQFYFQNHSYSYSLVLNSSYF